MEKRFSTIFEVHNVRTATMKVSYTPDDNVVYVQAAKTLNPNIDIKNGIAKGTKIFDRENTICMKLEWTEVAAIAKAEHPYYLKNWINKNFVHKTPKSTTILNVIQNAKALEKDELAISLIFTSTKNGVETKVFVPLSGDQTYDLAKALAAALDERIRRYDERPDKPAENKEANIDLNNIFG